MWQPATGGMGDLLWWVPTRRTVQQATRRHVRSRRKLT